MNFIYVFLLFNTKSVIIQFTLFKNTTKLGQSLFKCRKKEEWREREREGEREKEGDR